MPPDGKNWMVKHLEEPFFQIEMARCEMSKREVKGLMIGAFTCIAILLNLVC